jgi:hypothetical protein
MWRLTPMPVRQPPSRQTSKDDKAAVGIVVQKSIRLAQRGS